METIPRINLLYNFLTICTTDFNSFLDRINIFGSSTKSKLSDNFTGFNSEVNELFKDYIAFTLNKIRFSKIVRLYDYENLKKGNNVEDIKNIFTEENDFWFKVKSFLNKIKANRYRISHPSEKRGCHPKQIWHKQIACYFIKFYALYN